MKRYWAVGFILLAAVGYLAAFARRDPLIVHEWGTFTTVAGAEGASLEWRPLVSGNELPGFVYDLHALSRGAGLRFVPRKDAMAALVRMETPVIYFYAEHETNVSVQVGFPDGTITEWYP